MAEALWERFEEGWALIEDKLAAEASERALEDAALERRLALLRREEDAVAADERCAQLGLEPAKLRREARALRDAMTRSLPAAV